MNQEENNTFPIRIDLEKIKSEAKLKLNENESFRQYIKIFKSQIFDQVFHKIASEITSRIDCTQCGNCCKELHPAVSPDEVDRIAAAKGMTTNKFREAFLTLSETRDYEIMHKNPCTFLDGTKCSIYSNRPGSCADYPHLLKEDQKFRMRRVLSQYEICPIVYHTIETLKKETGFNV